MTPQSSSSMLHLHPVKSSSRTIYSMTKHYTIYNNTAKVEKYTK